jgi:hypothetical protein
MVLLYCNSPPKDQRNEILEYTNGEEEQLACSDDPNEFHFPASVVSVHYNSYNLLNLLFKCTTAAISGKIILDQYKYYHHYNLVHDRANTLDPNIPKQHQVNRIKKIKFSKQFTEPTHFGHFSEHALGGSGHHTNLFHQGALSNKGTKSWLEALSRFWLHSGHIYVNDAILFERELPLYTLDAETHDEARAKFTDGDTEAPAACIRITLVCNTTTNETILQTWLYSNYGCQVQEYDMSSSEDTAWDLTKSELVNPDFLANIWKRFVNVELKEVILGPGGAVNTFKGKHHNADNRDFTAAFKCPTRM